MLSLCVWPNDYISRLFSGINFIKNRTGLKAATQNYLDLETCFNKVLIGLVSRIMSTLLLETASHFIRKNCLQT
jgi:hypothetical protein